MAAVGDDGEQDVVALLRVCGSVASIALIRSCEMALIGEEGLARRGGDDLPAPACDRRQLQILAEVGLEHHVRHHAIDRHEIGDIDELAEPGDRLVEAGRLKLELGPRFPETGRPGVELLDAALLQARRGWTKRCTVKSSASELVIGVPEAAISARPGLLRRVDEADFHVEVPSPLRAFRIDAFQRRLVGGE